MHQQLLVTALCSCHILSSPASSFTPSCQYNMTSAGFLTVASFSSLPLPPKHSLVVSQCLCPAPPSPHVNWTSTWTHWVLNSRSSSAFSCFARCASYFCIVVIKHYEWGNLEKKTLIWGVQFQRVRVHSHRGGEHRSRQVGMEMEQQLSARALRHDCKADGVNWGCWSPLPLTHLLQQRYTS